MQIVKRTMNWFPKQSAYNYAQSLATKRREVAQASIADTEALANAFSSASSTASAGMVDITMKAALARIQAAAKAKLEEASKSLK